MAKPLDSCSSTPRSMSTCSPVIPPLMNNTTRFSALMLRSILQLIVGCWFSPFYCFTSSRAGFVKHVCPGQLFNSRLTSQQPFGFRVSQASVSRNTVRGLYPAQVFAGRATVRTQPEGHTILHSSLFVLLTIDLRDS